MSTQPTFSAAKSAERIGRAIMRAGLRPAPTHPINTLHLPAKPARPAMTVAEFLAAGGVVEVLS